MAKKNSESRIALPNGEVLEIHDELITQALVGLAGERDDAVQVVYDLMNNNNEKSRATARAFLKFHGRR